MKRFRFKLETLLKVTRSKKEEAEVRFAEASRKLEADKEKLGERLAEMQQGRKDYDRLTDGHTISLGRLLTFNSFFEWKREQIESQQAQILRSRAERQKRLKVLLQLMNKLKSIEQLKAKRLQQYKDEALLEEQKLLDEIGLQLYMRGINM